MDTDTAWELVEDSPIQLTEEQFESLWAKKPTDAQYCMMYGKTMEVPRNYAIYGQSYMFSGQQNKSAPVPSELAAYLEYGNSILVNWYENCEKYIGYHSDDQRGMSGCVYAFSYGAERRFKLWKKQPNK